jgi:DNA-binding response OmpR family regulator
MSFRLKYSIVKDVLIIEDDGDIADLVAIHLRDMDCNVSKASNGRIGYEKARDNTYDLIILDIMLPEMDGWKYVEGLEKKTTLPL